MKTNKSFAKRLKLTKNGKLIARGKGQNHFNSKESRRKQLNKARLSPLLLNNKDKSRFLSGM